MTKSTSRVAVLLMTLLYCSHQVMASVSKGGSLALLQLFSASTVQKGDDTYSSSISTGGTFPFGTRDVSTVYVSTNGYISMGRIPTDIDDSLNNFPGPSWYSVVAPFAYDIDTSNTGSVRYTAFKYDLQTSTVSTFIRSQTGNSFYGTRMMVAEWRRVPRHQYGFSSITNTFQGILITDGSSSYAVFIYECGGMEWGGGVIGWQASTSHYNSFYTSKLSYNNGIGCLSSTTSSAIVFKINDICRSDQFTCDNRKCVSDSYQCDGDDDCGDYSDEEGCVCRSNQFTCDNRKCVYDSFQCDGDDDCGDYSDEEGCVHVSLAVGASVGAFVFLIIVGTVLCILVTWWFVSARRRRIVYRNTCATVPSTTAVVVDTDSQTAALLAPVVQTPPPYQPQKGYPQTSPQILSNPVAGYYPQQNLPYPIQNQAHTGHPSADPLPNQAYPPPCQAAPQTDNTGDNI